MMKKKTAYRFISVLLTVAMFSICCAVTALANTKISDARNSVLRILCDGRRAYSTGTGFIIAQDGTSTYIVTNYHVIEDDPSNIYIITDNIRGNWIPAQVVSHRNGLDLVILKTESGLEDRPALVLSESENLYAAQPVYALGFPGAADEVIDDWDKLLSGVDDVTITNGIVSNASRKLDNGINAIQSTAALTYGNSGGPLLNEDAQVVGVNTWIYSEGAYGISYSIHIDYIIEMCNDNSIPYSLSSVEAPDVVATPEPPAATPVIENPPAPQQQSAAPSYAGNRGFLYNNLALIIIIASILILIALAVVLFFVSTFGNWVRRNKAATAILSSGILIGLTFGVILPVALSPGRSEAYIGESIASGQTSIDPQPGDPVLPDPGPQDPDTGAPAPALPSSAADIVGSWKLSEGIFLYHFGKSNDIAFFSSGDVYSSDEDKWATWHIKPNGDLVVEDSFGSESLFKVDIDEDTLKLTDSDGDFSLYDNVTGSLFGDWEFYEGGWIWVFGKSAIVSFDEDFKLYTSQTDMVTTWSFDESMSDFLSVFDLEENILREFRFCIVGDILAIIDEDGDVATFTRR